MATAVTMVIMVITMKTVVATTETVETTETVMETVAAILPQHQKATFFTSHLMMSPKATTAKQAAATTALKNAAT